MPDTPVPAVVMMEAEAKRRSIRRNFAVVLLGTTAGTLMGMLVVAMISLYAHHPALTEATDLAAAPIEGALDSPEEFFVATAADGPDESAASASSASQAVDATNPTAISLSDPSSTGATLDALSDELAGLSPSSASGSVDLPGANNTQALSLDWPAVGGSAFSFGGSASIVAGSNFVAPVSLAVPTIPGIAPINTQAPTGQSTLPPNAPSAPAASCGGACTPAPQPFPPSPGPAQASSGPPALSTPPAPVTLPTPVTQPTQTPAPTPATSPSPAPQSASADPVSPHGSTPENPIVPNGPTAPGQPVALPIASTANQWQFFDPPVAIGFNYQLNPTTPGQALTFGITQIMPVTSAGSGVYDLYLYDTQTDQWVDASQFNNNEEVTIDADPSGDTSLAFNVVQFLEGLTSKQDRELGVTNPAAGLTQFSLRGIVPAADINPDDPTDFVTGLFFTGIINGDLIITPLAIDSKTGLPVDPGPLVVSLPEPNTITMLGMALIVVGWWYRRRNG